ncbi:MAG: SRPBCC family protein [Anaerolineales bacterium]|jgi:carbon monoxide dehydrogenase subunit G|nr:SRPBCC family protein [Chloroflexota bacterium]MBK6645142.1 SRPBCC family protein [Anaerolineales bacterium]
MALIENTIHINASPDKVFAHITNLEGQKNQYVTSVEADGPIKLGTKIKTTVKAMNGAVNVITAEVVAFEQNKLYSLKTYGAPPASDVVSTNILEAENGGTKLTLQTEAVLVPPGMPSMPGMEDMMRKQMTASYDASLAQVKKAIEG